MRRVLPCRLCSGCYSFRKDSRIKNTYEEIRENDAKISELVEYSPCAAIKILLAYKDEKIARAFVTRYGNHTGKLLECDRRKDLIWETRGSIERLPYLANLAAMVEDSLLERTKRYVSIICGINSIEDLFVAENLGYSDSQQQTWEASFLFTEQQEKNSLTERFRKSTLI